MGVGGKRLLLPASMLLLVGASVDHGTGPVDAGGAPDASNMPADVPVPTDLARGVELFRNGGSLNIDGLDWSVAITPAGREVRVAEGGTLLLSARESPGEYVEGEDRNADGRIDHEIHRANAAEATTIHETWDNDFDGVTDRELNGVQDYATGLATYTFVDYTVSATGVRGSTTRTVTFPVGPLAAAGPQGEPRSADCSEGAHYPSPRPFGLATVDLQNTAGQVKLVTDDRNGVSCAQYQDAIEKAWVVAWDELKCVKLVNVNRNIRTRMGIWSHKVAISCLGPCVADTDTLPWYDFWAEKDRMGNEVSEMRIAAAAFVNRPCALSRQILHELQHVAMMHELDPVHKGDASPSAQTKRDDPIYACAKYCGECPCAEETKGTGEPGQIYKATDSEYNYACAVCSDHSVKSTAVCGLHVKLETLSCDSGNVETDCVAAGEFTRPVSCGFGVACFCDGSKINLAEATQYMCAFDCGAAENLAPCPNSPYGGRNVLGVRVGQDGVTDYNNCKDRAMCRNMARSGGGSGTVP